MGLLLQHEVQNMLSALYNFILYACHTMLKIEDPFKNLRETECQKYQSNLFFSLNTKLQNIIKEAGLIAKYISTRKAVSLLLHDDEKPP